MFGDQGTNFRQFPNLMPLHHSGRQSVCSYSSVENPGNVGRHCARYSTISSTLSEGTRFPMVSLVTRLTAWRSPTFFALGFLGSLRRVLRRRLRRIAGIAIQPGLQLIDPLLQLGNSFQGLPQSFLQYQDVSLNFWRKLFPNLWSKRSCLHKTVTNTLFTKVQVTKCTFLKKNCIFLSIG